MKRLVLGGILLLALAPAAWSQGQGKAAEAKPKMVVPEIVYDFGAVYEQEKLSHAFIIRNEGQADLKIESVKPG